MLKVNNKEERATSTVSLYSTLSLTLLILVSLLLTLNIFHILGDVKNAKIPFLYWKKRKGRLADCKLKCFSFRISKIKPRPPHVYNSPPPPPPPPPPNIGPSNLSFVRIYAQGVLTGFYGIMMTFFKY